VGEAKWSTLGARDARRLLDRLRSKASLMPLRAGRMVYLLAARDLRGEPHTLPDEIILTLDDYEALSRGRC
jgi:hypothetical protein